MSRKLHFYSSLVIFQELLGEERYEVYNFGLGSTTVRKSGDHPYWYTQEFNESIAMKPDIVIIQLGTNDAKVERTSVKCRRLSDFNYA